MFYVVEQDKYVLFRLELRCLWRNMLNLLYHDSIGHLGNFLNESVFFETPKVLNQ